MKRVLHILLMVSLVVTPIFAIPEAQPHVVSIREQIDAGVTLQQFAGQEPTKEEGIKKSLKEQITAFIEKHPYASMAAAVAATVVGCCGVNYILNKRADVVDVEKIAQQTLDLIGSNKKDAKLNLQHIQLLENKMGQSKEYILNQEKMVNEHEQKTYDLFYSMVDRDSEITVPVIFDDKTGLYLSRRGGIEPHVVERKGRRVVRHKGSNGLSLLSTRPLSVEEQARLNEEFEDVSLQAFINEYTACKAQMTPEAQQKTENLIKFLTTCKAYNEYYSTFVDECVDQKTREASELIEIQKNFTPPVVALASVSVKGAKGKKGGEKDIFYKQKKDKRPIKFRSKK